MKIAFHMTGGEEWQGGVAHLKVFLHALRLEHGNGVTTCLLAPGYRGRDSNDLGDIVDEILAVPKVRRWTVQWAIHQIIKLARCRDLAGASFLKRQKIDAVFGLCIQFGYDGIPTLSWVYDFQHLHMPEMFSLRERLLRHWAFFQTARRSTRVVVMSEAVKKDFAAVFPKYAHKARVLKTATYIPQSAYETNPISIAALHQLPAKFVYVPNQFWKHKNHEVVFKAVKLLKDRGIKVFVVCSGYQGDCRHPRYFSDLLQKVSDWGIGDQMKLLGLVPRDHVFQLMRQSICVLNPSLFEGFGLSVDEARSVGKKVLLSDIPAHREQDVPEAEFFEARNLEDLARKLGRIWRDASPGPDREREFEARRVLPERLRTCAESFTAVVREVAGA